MISTYLINLDSLTNVNETPISDNNTIFPNPVNNSFTLNFNLSKSGNCRIDLNNLTGTYIQNYFNGFVEQGNVTKTFDATNLAIGTYFIVVSSDGFNKTFKLIKEK